MRDSIVFYRSFYEAIRNLPAEDFKAAVQAIMEYGLNGREPETDGIERTIFLLVKPQIDANNRKWQNGKKGGRPVKPETEFEEPRNNQTETNQKPPNNQTETKPEPNVNVNVNENVNDKKKDTNVSKEKTSRFLPPTREDVSAYCQEKGYTVDADRFVDFYESKGWYVGKNKMKDWKAAVRNWARSQRQELTTKGTEKTAQKTRFHNFAERENDYESAIWQEIRKKNAAKKGEVKDEQSKC